MATDAAGNASAVSTEDYVITTFDVTPPVVSASPTGGTYANSVDVTLSATDDTDPTPTIYYTTDGSTPTTASPVYAVPITITADTTLNFMATDATGNASAVSTESYVITVTAEITIITVDGSGVEIFGYYTTLQQGGVLLEFGFSPMTFTVNVGESYLIGVSDFPPYALDFWDDGSTELHRTVSVTSDTTFTAHYLP